MKVSNFGAQNLEKILGCSANSLFSLYSHTSVDNCVQVWPAQLMISMPIIKSKSISSLLS